MEAKELKPDAETVLRCIAEGWEVIEADGDRLTIQSPEDDVTRVIVLAELDRSPSHAEGGGVAGVRAKLVAAYKAYAARHGEGLSSEAFDAMAAALSPSPDTVVVGREREVLEHALDGFFSDLQWERGDDLPTIGEIADHCVKALSSLPVEGGE